MPGILQRPTGSRVVVVGDRDDIGAMPLQDLDEAIGFQPGFGQSQDPAPKLVGDVAVVVMTVKVDSQALVERILRRLLLQELAKFLIEGAAELSCSQFVGAVHHVPTSPTCRTRSATAGF